MTEAAVQEVTESETTEESAPAEPTKEVKQVRLQPLPDSVLHPEPTAVKTIALGPVYQLKVEETNALLDDFANIREAYAKSEKALELSDHPLAIEFRRIKAATDATVKEIETESDEAKEIKKLQEAIAEKTKAARAMLKEKRDEAQKVVVGDSVSEYDPETLSQKLTDLNTVLLTMKKVLSSENPELSKWNVIDPAKALGKKGSRKAKTGTRRPRLAYAFIDGEEVAASGKYVTSSDVAKKLGVNDVGALNHLMFQAVGFPEQIPSETETHFNIKVNDVEHTVKVRGRTSSDGEGEVSAAA